MINFPGLTRPVISPSKSKRQLATHSAAIRKESAHQQSDRRRASDRRRRGATGFKGVERRCGQRRSGRINLSV